MRRRRWIQIIASFGATLLIVGCATRPDQHLIYVGSVQSGPALVSLGAGDTLGASIYANDVYLAARNRALEDGTAVAGAPVSSDD